MPRPDLQARLARLAKVEEEFLTRPFLSPAVQGRPVRVAIDGVKCAFRLQPTSFEGFGLFRPVSHREASLIREATLAERQAYLSLWPSLRFLLVEKNERGWLGLPAHLGDRRVQVTEPVPITLASEVQLFDAVLVRFDGSHFWFDRLDPMADPTHALALREAHEQNLPVETICRSGMSPEQKTAYAFRRSPRRTVSDRTTRPVTLRDRLRDALSHAGANLTDFLERDDSVQVRYRVDGRSFTSSVDPDDLSVHLAGVCLSGQDEKFDLSSLIGVLRRGGDALYRVGEDGWNADAYRAAYADNR